MVGLRLFLPESWTDDPERMARARVPKDKQTALTKPDIAIEEVDCVIASGARFGCVLADSGYGSSGPFRQALSERGLLWAVGLSRRQNVYPADVALIFPVAKAGKPRKYHIADQPPVCAETLLAEGKWQKVSWRRGTKGRLTCLFAARRVRVADGHKHRMLDNRTQCMIAQSTSRLLMCSRLISRMREGSPLRRWKVTSCCHIDFCWRSARPAQMGLQRSRRRPSSAMSSGMPLMVPPTAVRRCAGWCAPSCATWDSFR